MSQALLATPEVMKSRIEFYFDDYAWEPIPDTFLDGMNLNEFAEYLSNAFEAPYSVDNDFLMDFEERETTYLVSYVGEIDMFIDQMMGAK
jgi:hypothetical protein